MYRHRFGLVYVSLIIFFLLPGSLAGQTYSSYSALGLGDIYLPAQAHNQGMGGIGISNSSVFYQGAVNPALLADNAIYSFAAGFTSENKTFRQNDNREQASGASLSYLNMILPVYRNKIAVSLGLRPFSRVNYNFKTETAVEGNPDAEMSLFNKGEGGFNQFVLATGFKLTRSFYIGGRISYTFGAIRKERNNFLSQPTGVLVPTSVTREIANDFMFGAGAVYRHYFSEKLNASVGVTYDFESDLRVTRTQTLQIKSATDTPIRIDTIDFNSNGFVRIPSSYGLGFSVSKANQWSFGTDLHFQNWANHINFDGDNDNLIDTRLIKVGGEITPDITSVDNYFARITYRFGLNFDQTPYYIRDTQINEFGINFGLSLPVSNFSSVDLGFKYGSRGTTDNDLIREDFFRLYFGVTFNDNRWFVRPKFN